VIDDRPAFANAERFPEADELVVDEFEGIVEKLSIDPSSYLIAVTRGHQWDQPVIEQAVWTNAKYIGMIGSRRKIALMWKKLEDKGIPRHLLERVHAPIGVDIQADTPEEIAVSVVAQLIRVRRSGGKPTHMVGSASSELVNSK
jgi:xanthine dehydrogenase accessory factor